jgi:peptidoglycan-N-acetylglucosamine deacetylase
VHTLLPLLAGCLLLALVPTSLSLAGLAPPALATGASVVALLLLLLLIVVAVSQPGLSYFGPAVCAGSRSGARLALTFDDGPDPESTLALLEALRDADARATFFVLVDRAERWPELLRAIAAEHEVGLHGVGHHPWLTLWTPRRGARELEDGARRLEALCGQSVHLFRPPFGVTSPRLGAAVALAGLRTIWCSVRVRDGVPISDEVLLSRCRGAGVGDIVLLHEGPRPAARLVAQVLEEMAQRGVSSVSVSELLEAE